jgi:hypothetical protein
MNALPRVWVGEEAIWTLNYTSSCQSIAKIWYRTLLLTCHRNLMAKCSTGARPIAKTSAINTPHPMGAYFVALTSSQKKSILTASL